MPSKIRRRVIPLLLCLMAVFALTGCGPLLELNQKYAHPEIYVNYGTAVSTDISEYVNMDTLSKEEQKYVKKNSSVVYHGNKVSGHKYDRPGTYPLTIYYEDQVYRKYQVTIKDMEKPKFKKAKDVYIFKDTELTEYELQDLLKGMFKATDNSGKVKLKLSHEKINVHKVRNCIVHATATDPYGNVSQAKATFHVQKAEYGAMGTYIYVSIPKQQLTYFVDGKINMSSPVVTGTQGVHDTPRGSYYINSMSTGTRLKGQGYDVTVQYWMAFIGGSFGIHSAEWRGAFGGNIYQYGGSHGCVNMPVYAAGELFQKVDIGTPVIVGD